MFSSDASINLGAAIRYAPIGCSEKVHFININRAVGASIVSSFRRSTAIVRRMHSLMHRCSAAPSVFARAKSDQVNSFGSSAFKPFSRHSVCARCTGSRKIERQEGHIRDRGYRYGWKKGGDPGGRGWVLQLGPLCRGISGVSRSA